MKQKSLLFKNIFAWLFVFSIGNYSFAQCTNSSLYPTSAIVINPTIFGTSNTITTFQWAGEYMAFSNAVSGQSLTFRSSVTTDFFTVRSSSPTGPVIGFGQSPLTILNNFDGSIYLHTNSTSACGTQNSSRTTSYVLNKPATHLNFDGVNDNVALGNSLATALNGSNFVTAEAWINIPNVAGTKNIVGNNSNNATQFNLRIENNTLTGFVGAGTYSATSTAGTIIANTWQHVALVYNDTSLKIYINGVEVGSTAVPASFSLPTSSQQYLIGASGSASEFFSGNIDEVRIWNIERTAAEISTSRSCDLIGTETGLVTYYKFNRGFDLIANPTVTSLTNSVSGGANGTLTNFALTGSTSNWKFGSPIFTPITPTATTTVATCASNGTASISNYNNVFTYVSTPAGATVGATGIIAGTAGTSYTFVASTSSGCSSVASAGVTIPAQLAAPAVPTATTTAATCTANGTATISNYDVALTYVSNPTGATVGTAGAITGSAGTSYTFVATNTNGCPSISSASVIIPLNLTAATQMSSTQVFYTQGATATALTATGIGTGFLWYTTETGGTGSTTAPIPSTTTIGNTSYWVSQTIASCESARSRIVVSVGVRATHLNFDGVNDIVNFGTNTTNALAGSSFVTAEAWINIPNTTGTKSIVSNHLNSGTQFNLLVNNNALQGFIFA